jgi:hypothetical protein
MLAFSGKLFFFFFFFFFRSRSEAEASDMAPLLRSGDASVPNVEKVVFICAARSSSFRSVFSALFASDLSPRYSSSTPLYFWFGAVRNLLEP